MHHVNIGRLVPAAYNGLLGVTAEATAAASASGLDPLLVELVRIRASQINGCAHCLRLHSRDAIALGETADRLALVAAWWESQYFTAAERDALAITEQVTDISRVRPRAETENESVLSDDQVAAVTWLAIVINAWNRVAVASHYPVTP